MADDDIGRSRRRPPAWMVRFDRSRRSLLVVGSFLVLLALWPALGADDASGLQTSLTIGWIGLLLMLASLWQPSRLRRHDAWVSDVRPPMDDAAAFAPFAVATCSCGWQGPQRSSVDDAFADATAHAQRVDGTVDRPLG